MLKGIDVSSHNGYPLEGLAAAEYNKSAFVLVKATQGNYYVNPVCDPVIQDCITDGKLWGFYHYAGGCDPVTEANYFVENCYNYFGHGIPVIDWEAEENQYFGNPNWVRKFVNRVHELTGVWCVIYVSLATINQVQNCVNDCGLWVAQWGVSSPSPVDPWPTWTIWQWTSNNGALDQNYAQLDRESWARIATGDNTPRQTPTPEPTPSAITTEQAIDKMAQDVLAGLYGNGEARKNNLYTAIQKRVNELCT